MQVFELGEVIAERSYVFKTSTGEEIDVHVALGRPMVDLAGGPDAWYCPYRITGIERDNVHAMFGVDSLQALLHAVHIVPVKLAVFAREANGQLLCDGGAESTLLSGCRMAMKHASECFPECDDRPDSEAESQ